MSKRRLDNTKSLFGIQFPDTINSRDVNNKVTINNDNITIRSPNGDTETYTTDNNDLQQIYTNYPEIYNYIVKNSTNKLKRIYNNVNDVHGLLERLSLTKKNMFLLNMELLDTAEIAPQILTEYDEKSAQGQLNTIHTTYDDTSEIPKEQMDVNAIIPDSHNNQPFIPLDTIAYIFENEYLQKQEEGEYTTYLINIDELNKFLFNKKRQSVGIDPALVKSVLSIFGNINNATTMDKKVELIGTLPFLMLITDEVHSTLAIIDNVNDRSYRVIGFRGVASVININKDGIKKLFPGFTGVIMGEDSLSVDYTGSGKTNVITWVGFCTPTIIQNLTDIINEGTLKITIHNESGIITRTDIGLIDSKDNNYTLLSNNCLGFLKKKVLNIKTNPIIGKSIFGSFGTPLPSDEITQAIPEDLMNKFIKNMNNPKELLKTIHQIQSRRGAGAIQTNAIFTDKLIGHLFPVRKKQSKGGTKAKSKRSKVKSRRNKAKKKTLRKRN